MRFETMTTDGFYTFLNKTNVTYASFYYVS